MISDIIMPMSKRSTKKLIIFIVAIILLISGCNKVQKAPDAVENEGTPQATMMTTETLAPTPTLAPTASPTPQPHVKTTTDGRPWYIRVDTYNQMVSVYALDVNDEYTRLINQFMCTAGKKDNYTKKLFQKLNDEDRYRWKYFSTFGGGYCEYVTRIYKPFLFHSMMFEEKNEDTLMVDTYEEMTFPDSHGCIRVMPQDAKWIYENCIEGTYVEVVDGEADPDLTQSYMPPPLIDGKYLPVHEPFGKEQKVEAVVPNWDNYPSDGGWEYDPEVYG